MYSATLMVSLFSKSPAEGTDFPILELDLGWELPDFASIGMHIYVFPVENIHKTNLKFDLKTIRKETGTTYLTTMIRLIVLSIFEGRQVPRPPRFLFLVCIQYNTRKQKRGEKQGRPGCEVDVRVPATTKINHFLTGQPEYLQSCEHLGSCQVTEHLTMMSSMLFDPPPYAHLAST